MSEQVASFMRIEQVTRRFEMRPGAFESLLHRLGVGAGPQFVTAVDNVSLNIARGSIFGLVGESGCGKSTLGRIAARLLPATSGRVIFDDIPLDDGSLTPAALLRLQMVFQNPMASLNPRQRVMDIITEGAIYHGVIARRQRTDFAVSLLAEVGLSADAAFRLPHQFSGGQRQRIGIARALSVSPDFLICDEPVAALDVSIQAQIINLLLDLSRNRNLTMLFISHDLGVVRHLCDRVAVMYLGQIVEQAPAADLFANPRHPYTKALLEQAPSIKAGRRAYRPIEGEIPSPFAPPKGCRFHPRCPVAVERCGRDAPPQTGDEKHLARCWLLNDGSR
ncbi:MAG: ABC transporter ATP-binding protein [Rhizobiales bacterium 65-9]|nr:ABC transporter ATP-binding protein [Hyphomicrobiales bacterium]OJY35594.1 MAG: ABC transporter ATP-binding protein [Rhizobiales bacterium 65-9]